ncbi:MAG: FecR domain-containing protein, partial [Deltaproteobacteria bacterium]|nr:FecR domain-containing protein [Deltaproteobacteria bacterium]
IPIKSLQAKPQPDNVPDQESILVGRISHVEGELLRYAPEEEAWVATVKDEPFYTDDLLRSDQDGRAEFILPNNTWMRMDHDTQIQLHALKDDLTEVDVAFGLVRFHNKGSYAVIKATTPFGYVMAAEGASFDLYVGPDSVEVISLEGNLDFFHNTSEARFQVIAGKAAILADSRQVTAALGDVDPDWDSWNRNREHLWATRNRLGEESATYLPPSLHYEAYALEEHGRWERVYYNGAYSHFWRPVYVSVGWAPFTTGRWTVCYGENVWIPCEPFGYVTHHYGNWVFTQGLWYWAPPVARVSVRVGLPLLDIGFAWYPGRVAWIYSGLHIGWVPLAPYEPYYCHRRWGPRTVVVKNVNITNININKYAYINHAVVINKSKLYTANNYKKVRVGNIKHATLAKNYRVAPVLDNRVIKNYRNVSQRHHFKNAHVQQKPDRPVTNRIHQRPTASKQRVDIKPRIVRRDIPDARRGRRVETSGARSPKTRDTLARSNHVDKRAPKTDFRKTEQRERSSVRTQARLDPRKEMQTVRTGRPVKSARQQEVRTEKQRHTVPKVQRKSAPQPAKQQEVQVEDQRQAKSTKQKNKEESSIVPRNKPTPQAQGSNYSRATRQQTRREPQPQQSQPRQQNNRRSAEKERNNQRRNF